jgi:hypothetical protein
MTGLTQTCTDAADALDDRSWSGARRARDDPALEMRAAPGTEPVVLR